MGHDVTAVSNIFQISIGRTAGLIWFLKIEK